MACMSTPVLLNLMEAQLIVIRQVEVMAVAFIQKSISPCPVEALLILIKQKMVLVYMWMDVLSHAKAPCKATRQRVMVAEFISIQELLL